MEWTTWKAVNRTDKVKLLLQMDGMNAVKNIRPDTLKQKKEGCGDSRETSPCIGGFESHSPM